jgi:hypothetical protein
LILNWRKQLFEGAPKTFEVRRPDIAWKAAERKAQALEEKLREKDGGYRRVGAGSNELKKKILLAGIRESEDEPNDILPG